MRDPTLVTRSPLEPVTTSKPRKKKAKSEVGQLAKTYQPARQDVLFHFKGRTHRLWDKCFLWRLDVVRTLMNERKTCS